MYAYTRCGRAGYRRATRALLLKQYIFKIVDHLVRRLFHFILL